MDRREVIKMSSGRWDKKYSGYNQAMIEELAKLRHNQMRAWTKNMFSLLSKFQYEHKSLDDFVTEMLKLLSDNWVEYEQVPENLKEQSRVTAYAVIDIINKYYGLPSKPK